MKDSLLPETVLINHPQPEDLDAGWDGRGWYFRDDEGDLHGPFATRAECQQGFSYWWDDAYDDGGL